MTRYQLWYRICETAQAPFVYIHNRFVCPSDRVIIHHKGFGKGRYHDADYIMLFVMFQMLVDFIEIECSYSNHSSRHLFTTPWEKCYEWLRNIPVLHWFLSPVRNARRGLHRLRWEMTLDRAEYPSPQQAQSARELFRLYKFWVHDRPRRKNPFDGSLKGKYLKIVELEDSYDKEDEEMLHLLIKNRRCLWT